MMILKDTKKQGFILCLSRRQRFGKTKGGQIHPQAFLVLTVWDNVLKAQVNIVSG